MWNASKCQTKSLESTQLCASKYILGCCVTNCDEPVQGDLTLESSKYGRNLHRLKCYRKIMCTNDKRIPIKLLSNKWNNIKCRVVLENLGVHRWIH